MHLELISPRINANRGKGCLFIGFVSLMLMCVPIAIILNLNMTNESHLSEETQARMQSRNSSNNNFFNYCQQRPTC